MKTITENFGERLNALRTTSNLTVQELAVRASVPGSLISGLQTGHRTIGEDNATKIGKALGLSGPALTDFIYLAINNAVGKVLEEFQPYPAEILNLVANELRESGIAAEDVNRCTLHPQLCQGDADAAIYLKDGRSALIKVQIAHRS